MILLCEICINMYLESLNPNLEFCHRFWISVIGYINQDGMIAHIAKSF